MTETQKFFVRIISGGALMCAGFGGFPLSLVCCLIGYIIVGYDVLLRAGKNIAHGNSGRKGGDCYVQRPAPSHRRRMYPRDTAPDNS